MQTRVIGQGSLYFDVSEGCVAQALLDSLLQLVGTPNASLDILKEVGINSTDEPSSQTWKRAVSQLRLDALDPVSRALTEKSLGLISKSLDETTPRASEREFDRQFLGKIFGDTILCATLFSQVSPLEVSCSLMGVALGDSKDSPEDYKGWCLALLKGLPSKEIACEDLRSDLQGIAILKAISSHFGPRSEGLLMKLGSGKSGNSRVRALWYQPSNIPTQNSERREKLKAAPLIRVEGLLGMHVDLQDLMNRIGGLGARSIWSSQVFDMGTNKYRTKIQAVISLSYLDELVEALLVTGEAVEINSSPIDQFALVGRTVAVPYGKGQSAENCRIVEWLLGDKILRAEPVIDDLHAIASSLGYSQEIVRADVLVTWRKWRVQERAIAANS